MRWQIVNPAGLPGNPKLRALPIGGVEGKIVGFLGNRKPNSDVLFKLMGQGMVESGASEFHYFEKENAGVPGSPELIDEIAKKCDIVITGTGD